MVVLVKWISIFESELYCIRCNRSPTLLWTTGNKVLLLGSSIFFSFPLPRFLRACHPWQFRSSPRKTFLLQRSPLKVWVAMEGVGWDRILVPQGVPRAWDSRRAAWNRSDRPSGHPQTCHTRTALWEGTPEVHPNCIHCKCDCSCTVDRINIQCRCQS